MDTIWRASRFLFTALIFSLALATSAEAQSPDSGPQKVEIGVYLDNVEDIDLASNTYYLSFHYWLKWRGSIDPTKTLRFSNLLDEWGLTQTAAFPDPKILEDGSKYQRFTVEGKFFHKFWLGTFPLDWQKVTIEVQDRKYSDKELVYIPDLKSSAVHKGLAIPGWNIIGSENKVRVTEFGSNFGEGTAPQQFSNYRFGIKIERPVAFFLLKVFPPIAITLLCCVLVFFLDPSYVDARVGTAIAVLLTEVFLQLSFTGNLPSLGIMMLIDHIFNISYFLIFLALMACIYTTKLFDIAEAADEDIKELEGEEKAKAEVANEALRERIRKIDLSAAVGLSLLMLVSSLIVTLWCRGLYFFEMLSH